MAFLFADNSNRTVTANDLTIAAYFLYGCTNFHIPPQKSSYNQYVTNFFVFPRYRLEGLPSLAATHIDKTSYETELEP